MGEPAFQLLDRSTLFLACGLCHHQQWVAESFADLIAPHSFLWYSLPLGWYQGPTAQIQSLSVSVALQNHNCELPLARYSTTLTFSEGCDLACSSSCHQDFKGRNVSYPVITVTFRLFSYIWVFLFSSRQLNAVLAVFK